jgi:ubiquinone/menaquinone biosynthesis C-methylase UbiE
VIAVHPECDRRGRIAPGAGYLAIELAKLDDYKIVGWTSEQRSWAFAQKKAKEAGVAIEFRRGDAAHMPFGNETFDFVICRAAFKNFSDPLGALNEIYRVLRNGGQAVIIDLRRDASIQAINDYVNKLELSRVDSRITKLTFRFG